MKKVFVKKTLKKANKEDLEYWKLKSSNEKLDILQKLREEYNIFKNENRKGFQRVYEIVKFQ